MNYTQNYQLNQWDATDRVLRTDFNSDNQKIDAALKNAADAVAAEALSRATEDVYVKLLDLTLEEDTQKWDIDMSGIDLTKYQKLVLYPHLKGNTDQWVYLHLNGTSTEYGQIPMMNNSTRQNFGAVEITLTPELPRIFIHQLGVTSVYEEEYTKPSLRSYINFILSSGVTHLDTLNLRFGGSNYRILSGSTVQLYGIKH